MQIEKYLLKAMEEGIKKNSAERDYNEKGYRLQNWKSFIVNKKKNVLKLRYFKAKKS